MLTDIKFPYMKYVLLNMTRCWVQKYILHWKEKKKNKIVILFFVHRHSQTNMYVDFLKLFF